MRRLTVLSTRRHTARCTVAPRENTQPGTCCPIPACKNGFLMQMRERSIITAGRFTLERSGGDSATATLTSGLLRPLPVKVAGRQPGPRQSRHGCPCNVSKDVQEPVRFSRNTTDSGLVDGDARRLHQTKIAIVCSVRAAYLVLESCPRSHCAVMIRRGLAVY